MSSPLPVSPPRPANGRADESTPIFRSPRNFGGTHLAPHAETSPDLPPDVRPADYQEDLERLPTEADGVDAIDHAGALTSSVHSHDSAAATGTERRRSRRDRSSAARRANGSVRRGQIPGDSSSADDGAAEPHAGVWRRMVDKYGSVELDNKGSVARDHLALERTFLAWMRTSLSFASIGIAITQLFRLNTTLNSPTPEEDEAGARLRQMGKPLGATFLGIAIVVLLAGWRRYFEAQHWIIRGKFPASRGSVLLVTLMSIALIVTSLVVVVLVKPTQQGS